MRGGAKANVIAVKDIRDPGINMINIKSIIHTAEMIATREEEIMSLEIEEEGTAIMANVETEAEDKNVSRKTLTLIKGEK